eukprot:g16593.t1
MEPVQSGRTMMNGAVVNVYHGGCALQEESDDKQPPPQQQHRGKKAAGRPKKQQCHQHRQSPENEAERYRAGCSDGHRTPVSKDPAPSTSWRLQQRRETVKKNRP